MFKIIKMFKSLPLRSSTCIPRNRKFFSMHPSKGRHSWALLFAMIFFYAKGQHSRIRELLFTSGP